MRKSRFTDSQIMDALRRVEAGIGVPDLRWDMGAWYHDERPHSSLDGQTPTRVWLDSLITLKVAA